MEISTNKCILTLIALQKVSCSRIIRINEHLGQTLEAPLQRRELQI